MTARPASSKPLTIVIKLGTSSIVSPTYPFLPHLQLLSSVVETVVQLRELGHRVVLCSSGAIGVGLRRMNLKERGKGLSHKQALAAIGQGRLIALWDNLFSQLDQPIAQVLLTRMDISDRTRYLNAQNTFSELLQMGVVPIVNENDTVSVSEIKFGDNDTLSAISSAIVHADYLFLLTDVDCLYTDNPRHNPDAKPVRVVRDIEKVKQQVSFTSLGSSLGTGGMATKLIAAELGTAAGTTTVIMHSEKVADIFRIVEGGPGPSREGPEEQGGGIEHDVLCTRFLRRENAMKDRKWWIAHGLHAAGSVVIDEGACRAIKRKESGGRLLPAGVIRVEGVFASSQAVRLIVRRRKRSEREEGVTDLTQSRSSMDGDWGTPPRTGTTRGDQLAPFAPSASTAPAAGPSKLRNSATIVITDTSADETGGTAENDSANLTATPPTPAIEPILSLSSSIASLDPLSRSSPSSPAARALADRLASTVLGADQGGASPSQAAEASAPMSAATTANGDSREKGVQQASNSQDDEWEEVEIGKGLAQYNSMEIDRLKGMKSSHIEKVIGYCESEHVVESILIWQ